MNEFQLIADFDEVAAKHQKNCAIIEKLINFKLKMKDYSKIIKCLSFSFVAVNTEKFKEREEKVKFKSQTKTFEIVKKLDYKTFCEAESALSLKMMSELYLQGIQEIDRKDFDLEKFVIDVKESLSTFLE